MASGWLRGAYRLAIRWPEGGLGVASVEPEHSSFILHHSSFDPTRGATHFGNLSDVRKGTFTGLQLTCIVGAGRDATYFFRTRS